MEAQTAFQQLPEDTQESYNEATIALKERFKPPSHQSCYQSELGTYIEFGIRQLSIDSCNLLVLNLEESKKMSEEVGIVNLPKTLEIPPYLEQVCMAEI